MITFEQIRNNREIKTYIIAADKTMESMGYTEHSFAHVMRTAVTAGDILTALGYDRRTVELGKIAGYIHDIGNVINRLGHAQSGAVMAFRILDKLGMDSRETAKIICAVGNHDESSAFPVNELAAALILADKSDVRRSRVRDKNTTLLDIHDRVNYAVEKSALDLDLESKTITLNLSIDEKISNISEYFEIFLSRMLLCKKASEYFDLSFTLNINHTRVM